MEVLSGPMRAVWVRRRLTAVAWVRIRRGLQTVAPEYADVNEPAVPDTRRLPAALYRYVLLTRPSATF